MKEQNEKQAIEVMVKVIRCRDCFFSHRDYRYEDGYACEKPLFLPQTGEKPHRKLMQGCDYCSYGVSKDGSRISQVIVDMPLAGVVPRGE